jgi:intracellular sulfur oxidation DsrE/DsrF family protein
MQVIAQQPGKYILHISVRDKKKFKQTLDQAEALMANYRNTDQGIELEIIANAGGLDLFREDVSPYAQRVKQLRQRYPNIKFVACSNAIERLREQGIEPKLINSVHQGATAIDQVVKRIHQGWSYIKI